MRKCGAISCPPLLQTAYIATLDNAVVRASVVVPIDTKPVFAAIASLDKTARFSKNLFGEVEIMKVPLDAQHDGRVTQGADGDDGP